MDETIRCFEEVEDVLFSELLNYFGYDYGNEDYKCYLSIFDCNPRYIESKSFQVYYRRPFHLRKEVIVHELTHFAFFDFCHKIGLNDSKELWELSEIFNVIFLNLPSLQAVIGAEESLFYPDLTAKLEQVRGVWARRFGAKEFILASLRAIQ